MLGLNVPGGGLGVYLTMILVLPLFGLSGAAVGAILTRRF